MSIRSFRDLYRWVLRRAAFLPQGVLFLYFLFSTPFLSGSEIDRLLVAVNGKVITEGDLSLARNLNTIVFYDQNAQPNSRETEIDSLVNLELLRQELKNFSVTQEDANRVEARLQSLRDVYAGKGGLPQLLRQLGLQESELLAFLQLQSSILKFIDFRFRPFVKVSEEEIKAYYEGRLAAQLQKANLPLPALTQVSSRIEGILKEEKINALLDQWVTETRRNSRIEYFNTADDFPGPGVEKANK